MSSTDWGGVRLVPVERFSDERGGFFSPWDRELAPPGFSPDSLHLSHNVLAGTLRGLHYQTGPHAQAKLVYCVRGSVFDVVVDVRTHPPGSADWKSFRLTGLAPEALWIPPGHAHGFTTLEPDTTLAYLISGAYRPEHAAGLRWNDPRLAIEWPVLPRVISDKDRCWPLLSP